MRIVLRILALVIAGTVLLTAAMVFQVAASGYFGSFIRSGALGAITLVSWALVLLLGPFAAVELWRLRQSGRRAAIALTVAATAYYLTGAVFLRAPGVPLNPMITAIVANLGLALLLLTPAARRACHPRSTPL